MQNKLQNRQKKIFKQAPRLKIMSDVISELGLDFFRDIKIPKEISHFFKPSGEISKEKYFTKYLSQGDAMHLQLFLGYFASRLEREVEILAVGNSTFSKEFWNKMKKIKKKNPKSEIIPDSYQDIDLLVLPKYGMDREILEKDVKKALTDWELRYDIFKRSVSSKDFFERIDGSYTFLVNYDVGNRIISTKLPNNTELDLILGKDNYLKSAKEKIKEERKNKNPFCIIYKSD